MTSKMIARLARSFLIAMSFGCLMATAQQDAPSAENSSPQTSASSPSQTESQPTQDQNEVPVPAGNGDSAKSQAETKTQSQPKPAKKQSNPNVASPTHRHPAKRGATAPPSGTPKKIVVRQGGAEDPTAQIVTGMTAEEADRQRNEAEFLLSTTDEKLKEIAPRPLDSQQEETVLQIHNFMEGSRAALKQGDVSRAHTLAQKAGLLAEDLASH